MKELNFAEYAELHRWSVAHRSVFWKTMVDKLAISFRTPYQSVLDLAQGVENPQWFVGGTLNISESCFQSAADRLAIVERRENGAERRFTYGELNALSQHIAHGLTRIGFRPNDAIAIMMPMTIEAVAIYLGIIAAGCVVVSVADSFSSAEVETRLRLANARGIFIQDVLLHGGKRIPLYERLSGFAAPRAIVLPASMETTALRKGDVAWSEFLPRNAPTFAAIARQPSDHCNILFSSGTTGEPKAIPWTHTTPIKCASDAYLHHDIHPDDILCWPTNLGWMMGPWLIYASLINRAAMALYVGAPQSLGFAQFVRDANVTMLGVVPSLVSAWRKANILEGVNWTGLRLLSSTGECSNPDDMNWLMQHAGGRPMIEYCGGTEIGGGYITSSVVHPCVPSTFTTPALGIDFVILDEQHASAVKGEAFIKPPSVGLSTTLLHRDHHDVYFAETPTADDGTPLRRHGDELEALPGGLFRAHGRADDTMNLGGIKVSSAEIERCANTVPGIRESAAIAIPPVGGGPSELIVCLVVDSPQLPQSTMLSALQQAISQQLNPLFKVSRVVVLPQLPRTASNKVMRRTLREMVIASGPLKTHH